MQLQVIMYIIINTTKVVFYEELCNKSKIHCKFFKTSKVLCHKLNLKHPLFFICEIR